MRQSHARVDKSEEARLGMSGLHKPRRGGLGAGGRYHPPHAEAFRIPKLTFLEPRQGEGSITDLSARIRLIGTINRNSKLRQVF